jgi:hypothetical protein
VKLAARLSTALITLAGLSGLAGCASHGTWLDRIGERPTPPRIMSDAQAIALQDETARLRLQAESVRLQLGAEGDRHRRFSHYRDLQQIRDRLAPLERSLFEADRPSRHPSTQPAAPSRL